jgi:predicted GNAT family N-acyltransferase
MCFVWISEQTAIISLYSINWLVFVTETECVYCAVRTESLNATFCPHSVFMCFVQISEQTAIISLYSINWLVFITETECVYCAVRTELVYRLYYFDKIGI